ncbi:MAG: hypothetical protein JSU65_09175 [Candidatus Zixiibacteriota bacterium]|nr:MAG: hypothetical protein JSU65_09175 [candidate division Zixibacteria bacterium]
MGLKDIVGNIQLSRARRRMQSGPLTFPTALLNRKHVLVCLPAGLRELTMVKQFLPAIAQLFKPADITLLSMPGIRLNDIYPRKGFQILTPTADQLSWAGLPKSNYLEHLRSHGFDTVLDLNLELSKFTSTVLLNFPDAIRIGRGNHLGEPYYNLEIKTKYLRDEKNIYRSLLETVGLMMNRPVEDLTSPAPR